jgi:3-isopropylmalate/(R)-2-methylmalate dehydratase small subunit
METLTSQAMLLPIDNIDTDRIIPARFLITTKIKGLGRHFFNDWVHGENTKETAKILVAGHNFGCGSSREHAVWALADYGIEAVVSTKFADIFHANALRNRLVPVVMRPEDHERLVAALEADGEAAVTIDYEARRISCNGFEAAFTAAIGEIGYEDPETPGVEELETLLAQGRRIDEHEAARKPRVNTLGDG